MSKRNNGESGSVNDIIPLEELDKKYTFSDVRFKAVIMREGERSFVNSDKKEIEYTKANCISIRAPGKRDKDGNCTIEIPILVAARMLGWIDDPLPARYFDELAQMEIAKNSGIKMRSKE